MELLTLIVAVLAIWLVVTGLVKVVKATVRTAVTIAILIVAIALVLRLVFDLDGQDLWRSLQQLFGQH